MSVPPGLYPPLLTVDESHRGAWIAVSGAIGLTLSIFSLLVRVYVRAVISPPFSKDDVVFFAAMIFTLVQSAIIFRAIDKGFGTSIELLTREALDELQKLVYASDLLYLIALYLAKICIITMFLRLTPRKIHNLMTKAIFGLSTVWVLAGIFMISINCQLQQPWEELSAKCGNLYLRWQLIGYFDVVSEACLFGLALYLTIGLKMPVGKKVIVLATFGARVPTIALTLVRLHHLDAGLHSANPPFDMALPSTWTQVGLNYSLIACTSFCLKPFTVAVSTNYGVGGGTTSASYSRSRSGYATREQNADESSKTNSQSFSRFNRRRRPRSPNFSETLLMETLPGKGDSDDGISDDAGARRRVFQGADVGENRTMVTNEPRHDADSVGSNDSTRMIIRKDVTYTVEYGHRTDDASGNSQNLT